jgi:hypothetical protein
MKYTIPAYLILPNDKNVRFWCMQKKTNNITEEIGQPMGNGYQYLETDTQLNYQQEQMIDILGQKLSIDEITTMVKTKDKNARRGKPDYIYTLRVS